MVYYSLWMVLVSLIPLYYSSGERELKLFFASVAYFSIVIVSGLRVGGIDYENYKTMFELVSNGYNYFQNTVYGVEVSYLIVCDLSNQLGLGIQGVFLFYSITTSIFLYKSFSKLCENPIVALLMYVSFLFIVRDMAQIRSGLAGSILLYSICFMIARDYKKSTLWILVATLVHASSIVFISSLVTMFIKPSRNKILMIPIVGFLFGYIGIGGMIIESISSDLIGSYFSGKLNDYTVESSLNYKLGLFDITNIKNILVCILCAMYINSINNKSFGLCSLVFVIGVTIRLVFSDFSTIGGRTASILTVVEPVIIATVFHNEFISRHSRGVLIPVGIISYSLLMLILSVSKYGSPTYFNVFTS